MVQKKRHPSHKQAGLLRSISMPVAEVEEEGEEEEGEEEEGVKEEEKGEEEGVEEKVVEEVVTAPRKSLLFWVVEEDIIKKVFLNRDVMDFHHRTQNPILLFVLWSLLFANTARSLYDSNTA